MLDCSPAAARTVGGAWPSTRMKALALQGPLLGAVLIMLGCNTPGGKVGGADQTGPGDRGQPFVRALPDVREYVRLLGAGQSVVLHSGLVTLQPGENCGWHSTEDHEELVICLAGEGEIEAGSLGRSKLAAGHIAYNPPQTRHNVFNTGTQPMRYIYVVAPVPDK